MDIVWWRVPPCSTKPTAVPKYIKESHDLAELQWMSVHITNSLDTWASTDFVDYSHAHMPWNDRIGNARQLSLRQVHVSATHFTAEGPQ